MKKITKKQFIEEYCIKSKIDYKTLQSYGMKALKCDCDFEGCRGWQMRNINLLSTKELNEINEINLSVDK